jgi:hypothetical protein
LCPLPGLEGQLEQSEVDDYFHTLLTEWEIDFLQEERPEVVIVRAGFRCILPLTPRAKEVLMKYKHLMLSTLRAMEHISC